MRAAAMSRSVSFAVLALASCAGVPSRRAEEPRAQEPRVAEPPVAEPRAPGTVEAHGRTFAPECEYDLACQGDRLLTHLSLTPDELGPDLVLARYGTPNPGCWTVRDAPPGPERRLRGVLESGAGAATRLCYFEYERRGTHDDVIVKVFLFANPTEAERALRGAYLQRKRARLAEADLGPPTRRDNVVFYVTASESNLEAARRIHRLVDRRLSD